MLRALLWKDWRQLRALRWTGLALGAVLPVAFLAGAKAAKPGMLFGGAAEGATSSILLEVLPVTVALAVWPLMALLLVSQAFAGDRASGVESFLLERPVPRSRIWFSRLAASAASWLVVAAGTGAIAALLVLAAAPAPERWRDFLAVAVAGALVASIAAAGALAAASLVPSPMTALLLGLLLGTAPVGASLWLSWRFPFASYRGVPLGLVTLPVLAGGFAVASWVASCRGEPMGRGRATRFGIVLGAALALALAGFFALAPAAVRRHALGPGETRTVIPSPSGGVLIAVSARTDSGCLVDAETGRVERILPPPVESAIVSPDGRVAVVTWAGSFGAMADRARVEFFDARGRRVGAGASLMDGVAGHWGTWAGSAVALPAFGARSSRIAFVDGGTGAVRIVDVPSTWGRWSLVGPTLDGRLFVAIGPEEPEAADARGPVRGRAQTAVAYDVVEVDILEGRLGAKPILRELGVPWRAPHLLSPSGRYWLVDRGAGICDARPILELENGLDLGPPSPLGRRTWLSGDVLAWLETSGDTTWLFVARPGEDPKPVRGWRTAFVQLQPSPDRALLLVHARGSARHSDLANRCPGPSASRVAGLVASGPVPQTGIYDPGRGVWSDLPAWEPAEGLNFDCERVWAGPRTLARTGPGFLALEDIDRPGAIREVLGRSP